MPTKQKHNLTLNMFAGIQAILRNELPTDAVRNVNYSTFGPMIEKREYVKVVGEKEFVVTPAGYRAYMAYIESKAPLRKHPGEISDRVLLFLGMQRKERRRRRARSKSKITNINNRKRVA